MFLDTGKYPLSKLPPLTEIKVVLTGDYFDECFGGYPCFRSDCLCELNMSWASALPEDERRRICAKAGEKWFKNLTMAAAIKQMTIGYRMLNTVATILPLRGLEGSLGFKALNGVETCLQYGSVREPSIFG